jgi:alpha-N-arabinofuranosidase
MSALAASVRVAADPAPGREPVRRALFGKFTEHLGRNVYGGAWAQLVPNPAFAPQALWPDGAVLARRLAAAEEEFRLAGLAAASGAGVPPWWTAEGGVRLVEEAGGGRWSAVAGGDLVTALHLPVQRTSSYRLELDLRSDVPLEATLRLPGEAAPWAAGSVAAAPAGAVRVTALEGRAGVPAGTPFHLRLAPRGPGRVEVRRCLLWPADHLEGWDPDVVGLLRAARLPLLRFPGGNFVSGYRWRDGVGPVRRARPNPAWPEVEWNHVGTDEWLRLCELVGCEALICVNAGDGTPDEAADWVEYCNGGPGTPMGALRAGHGHPAPHGVRLWEVGNEIYGSWQVGHTDAAGYAQRYGRFAAAMLARDPGVRLIANGHTQEWNQAVVAANPGRVAVLSHHCLYGGFPPDADPRRVFHEHMAFTPAYGRMWHDLVRPFREAGLPPRLAITEQQVFTHQASLPTNATLTEAVWTASILNEAIRSDGLVELLTHSALVNHGGGLRKERGVVYAQPVWWTTHLYATAPEPLLRLDCEVESPGFDAEPYRLPVVPAAPYLDAVALAAGGGGGVVLFLVNRHPDRTLAVTLSLPARTFRRAEVVTLTGASFMAANSFERPDAVRPVREERAWDGGSAPLPLPPCSLVRLHLA